MSSIAQKRKLATALAVAASLIASGSAHAATYNVNRTDDPSNTTGACATGGECSLREALNTVAASPSPPDVINLPAGNYTDDLNIEFAIGKGLSLVGAGSGTTIIHGSPTSRVFHITSSVDSAVSISGVTITGGHAVGTTGAGGGILVEPGAVVPVTFDRIAVIGNAAGTAGGGISVFTPTSLATITNSLIANNTAGTATGFGLGGGGLALERATTIVNSTITGNTAGNGTTGVAGGGIKTFANGASAPPYKIVNSSIVANAVNGTSGSTGGNIAITGSAPDPAVTRNSIIAGGSSTPAGTENCTALAIVSQGYNIEDRNQCGLTQSGDQPNTNPMLGTLAASPNAASTLALLPGSPGINAGDPAGCTDAAGAALTVDERGIARPQAGRCDIGAFEFQAPTVTGPTVTGTPRTGSTLTCAANVASPDGPATTTFAWTRDGAAIPGATTSTFAATATDAGHKLACGVVATNAAGKASATSPGVTVQTLGSGRPYRPWLGFPTTAVKITVKTGKGRLTARCHAPKGDHCVLSATIRSVTGAKRLGTAKATIAAGALGKITIQLTPAARKTLQRKRHLTAKMKGKVSDRAGTSGTQVVKLTLERK
jgi:hypothetical protein